MSGLLAIKYMSANYLPDDTIETVVLNLGKGRTVPYR